MPSRGRAPASALAAALGTLPGVAGAVEAGLSWVGDFGAVIDGGLREGERHWGLVEATLDHVFDLGAREVEFHASGQHLYGGGWSAEWVGDLQVVSNIDADPGTHVFEAWIDVPATDALSVRFGRYDFNSEFDVIDAGGLFLGSSHGIGPDISQTGAAGPSIFPNSALALRLEYERGERGRVRGVALDVEPPRDASGGEPPFFGGPMLAFEYEGGTEANLWKAGVWAFTHSREHLLDPAKRGREFGGYGSLQRRIDEHWVAFVRLGLANEQVSRLGSYAGAGLVREGGWLPGRDDVFGIAVAHARNGSDYRHLAALEGAATDAAETAIELTWRVPLGEHLVLQPDLQYVVNPETDPSIDDALVLMLRVELAF